MERLVVLATHAQPFTCVLLFERGFSSKFHKGGGASEKVVPQGTTSISHVHPSKVFVVMMTCMILLVVYIKEVINNSNIMKLIYLTCIMK